MEFREVLTGRRSIRKFRERMVPDSEIEALVDMARHSPSSMNGQPWHFVIVRSPESKASLAEIKNHFCPPEKKMFRADFMRTASFIMLICVEKERSYGREIENGVLAASHVMLAAHSLGLGSVYMSAYIPEEPQLAETLRKQFAIPETLMPVSILPIGYPDEIPKPKELRPVKEIIHRERF